jgi:hypothetical protein
MSLGSISPLPQNIAEAVAPPSAEQWLAAAWHEAGHVAAHLRFGLRFNRVLIHPTDDGLDVVGAVTVTDAGNREFSGLKYAIICLCGPASEARFTNVSVRQLLASPIAATDLRMAEDALQHATGSPSFDVAIAAARRVIEAEWSRIDRLARALRRHGELSYDECKRIAARR